MEESNEKTAPEQFQRTNGEASPEAIRIAELEAQLAQTRQEAADNWNKFLRERADLENSRKRQERVLADRVHNQKKALIHKILGVMDNVERALIYQDTMS